MIEATRDNATEKVNYTVLFMLSLKRIRIKSRCFQETPTSRTRNNTSLKVIRWYMTLSYCYCLILNAGQLPIWLFFFFPSQWAIEVVIFLMMFLLKRKKNNGQETPDPITSACQSGSQPFQLLYLVIYLVQFSILLSGLEYSHKKDTLPSRHYGIQATACILRHASHHQW